MPTIARGRSPGRVKGAVVRKMMRSIKSPRMSQSLGRCYNSAAKHINYYDKYAKQTEGIPDNPLKREGIIVNGKLKLSDIVRQERLMELSSGSIAQIWMQYHEKKPYHNGLVVAGSIFVEWMQVRAGESPTFIIPLPVGQNGALLNYVVQHPKPSEGSCKMTLYSRLDDYQRYGGSAPIRMVAYCFDEFLQKNEVALIRSNFGGDNLNREQADYLLKSTIDAYTNQYSWVQQFNHQPESFDWNSFLSLIHAKQRNKK